MDMQPRRHRIYLFIVVIGLLTACSDAAQDVSDKKKPDPIPEPIVDPILDPEPAPDTTAPHIILTSPKDNAIDVGIYSVIRVTFDEALDPSTVHGDNVNVYFIAPDQPAKPITPAPGSEGLDYIAGDKTIRFKPQTPLISGGQYRVDLLADNANNLGIKDVAGNVLQANVGNVYRWTFTVSSQTNPEALVSFTPAPNDLLRENTAPISVVLNAALTGNANLSPDVLNDTMTVTLDNGTPWSGDVQYDTDTATLQFTSKLPGFPLNSKLHVDVHVKNLSGGDFLKHSWQFDIADGAFLEKIPGVINVIDSTDDRKVLVDSYGNVTVLWIHNKWNGIAVVYDLMATHYSSLTAQWSDDTTLDTVDGEITFLNATLDTMGNITVVWQQQIGLEFALFARRYDYKSQSGWESAPKIEFNSESILGIQLLLDQFDNVTMLWLQRNIISLNETTYDLMATRFTPPSDQWSTTVTLDIADGYIFSFISGVDAAGNATVVWQQQIGQEFTLFARRYDNETLLGWESAPHTVSKGTSIFGTQILFDTFGDTTLLWIQRKIISADVTSDDLMSARFIAQSGQWKPSSILNTGTVSSISYNSAVVDKVGNITVVWRQSVGQDLYLFTRRYNRESQLGWELTEPPKTLSTSAAIFNPQLLIDSSNNVTLMWVQLNKETSATLPSYDPMAVRFTAQSGQWTGDVRLDTKDGTVSFVNAIVDATGNITVVWQQKIGQDHTLYTRHFDQDSQLGWQLTEPPTILSASVLLSTSQLLIDPSGHATLLWIESVLVNGSPVYDLKAARYTPQLTGWNVVTLDNAESSISNLDSDVDTSGNITVVWQQNNQLLYNRFQSRP